MNKYAGLDYIADCNMRKQALLDNYADWTAQNPLKTLAGYMTPVVGTGMALTDAAHSFSQGRVLGGIGNTLLAGLTLIPGGGAVKGIGKGISYLARGGRGAAVGGKLERAGQAAIAAGQRFVPQFARDAGSRIASGVRRLGNPNSTNWVSRRAGNYGLTTNGAGTAEMGMGAAALGLSAAGGPAAVGGAAASAAPKTPTLTPNQVYAGLRRI